MVARWALFPASFSAHGLSLSAFGNDTINLLRDGRTFHALANIAANVILGLALVWFGRIVAYLIWK